MKKNNLNLYQVDLVTCNFDIYAEKFDFNRDLIYFYVNNQKTVVLSYNDVLKISLFYNDSKDYDIVFANSLYYCVRYDD